MNYQLNRYIFTQLARRYIATVLVLSVIVWAVQVVNLVDNLVGASSTALEFLYLTMLILPRVLSFVLAPALLISVISQLVAMQQTNEYFAIAASGVSPLQMLKPILWLVVVATILLALVSFYIAPLSLRNLQAVQVQAASGAVASSLPANSFADITPNITVFVGEAVGANQWRRIMIEDRSDEVPITYLAQRGAIATRDGTSYFILENGTLHTTLEGQETDSVSFGEYVLPFALPPQEKRLNRNHLMIHQLFNPTAYGVSNRRSIERMQRRANSLVNNLANPLVFMLIGFVVVVRQQIKRHGPTRYIAIAAVLGLIFYLGNNIFANSENNLRAAVGWTLFWVIGLLYAIYIREHSRPIKFPTTSTSSASATGSA